VQAQNYEHPAGTELRHDKHPAGIFNDYQIRLDTGAGTMISERDHDEFVKKFMDVEEDRSQPKSKPPRCRNSKRR
jgi:hypothetical protein